MTEEAKRLRMKKEREKCSTHVAGRCALQSMRLAHTELTQIREEEPTHTTNKRHKKTHTDNLGGNWMRYDL